MQPPSDPRQAPTVAGALQRAPVRGTAAAWPTRRAPADTACSSPPPCCLLQRGAMQSRCVSDPDAPILDLASAVYAAGRRHLGLPVDVRHGGGVKPSIPRSVAAALAGWKVHATGWASSPPPSDFTQSRVNITRLACRTACFRRASTKTPIPWRTQSSWRGAGRCRSVGAAAQVQRPTGGAALLRSRQQAAHTCSRAECTRGGTGRSFSGAAVDGTVGEGRGEDARGTCWLFPPQFPMARACTALAPSTAPPAQPPGRRPVAVATATAWRSFPAQEAC